MNRLLHGDCLEVLPTLPANSVDLILADLPYGTTRNPWDSIIPLDQLWAEYLRVAKPNAAIVLTAAPPFDKVLAVSNLKHFRYEWIWHKNKATGHLNAKKMPLRAHENVLVFYRKQPTYNPQITTGHNPMNVVYGKQIAKSEQRNYNHCDQMQNLDRRTTRQPRDVLNVRVHDNVKTDKFHPTQKPLELMEYMIRTYSNVDDVVLDNVMGAGTTCVAAKGLNRGFIGIEREQKYFEHSVKRVNQTIAGSLLSKTPNELVDVSVNVAGERLL